MWTCPALVKWSLQSSGWLVKLIYCSAVITLVGELINSFITLPHSVCVTGLVEVQYHAPPVCKWYYMSYISVQSNQLMLSYRGVGYCITISYMACCKHYTVGWLAVCNSQHLPCWRVTGQMQCNHFRPWAHSPLFIVLMGKCAISYIGACCFIKWHTYTPCYCDVCVTVCGFFLECAV